MTNMEMIACIIIYVAIILGVLFMVWGILDLFETNKFKIKCVRRQLGAKEIVDYYPLRMHCSFVWHEMCENVFGSYNEAAGYIRLVYEREHPTHIPFDPSKPELKMIGDGKNESKNIVKKH